MSLSMYVRMYVWVCVLPSPSILTAWIQERWNETAATSSSSSIVVVVIFRVVRFGWQCGRFKAVHTTTSSTRLPFTINNTVTIPLPYRYQLWHITKKIEVNGSRPNLFRWLVMRGSIPTLLHLIVTVVSYRRAAGKRGQAVAPTPTTGAGATGLVAAEGGRATDGQLWTRHKMVSKNLGRKPFI